MRVTNKSLQERVKAINERHDLGLQVQGRNGYYGVDQGYTKEQIEQEPILKYSLERTLFTGNAKEVDTFLRGVAYGVTAKLSGVPTKGVVK